MRTYEISSPAAAELYFNQSFVGDMATFLGGVIGKLAGEAPKRPAGRSGTKRDTTRGTKRDTAGSGTKRGDKAPHPSIFDRLDRWFWRQEQKTHEAYLAGAHDVFDLERRIDAIDRGLARRPYY